MHARYRLAVTLMLALVATAFAQNANTALSNLSSTAINTDLRPGVDKGAALGSSAYEFSSLNIGTTGVFNNSTWAPGIDARTNGAIPPTMRADIAGFIGSERDVTVSAAQIVPSSSADYESDAIAAMIFGACNSLTCTTNAVAGSFFAAAHSAGISTTPEHILEGVYRNRLWGVNVVLTDTDQVLASGATTGYDQVELLNEIDVNVYNSDTIVHGLSIGGGGKVKPYLGLAYLVNALGTDRSFNTIHWDAGYMTNTDCCAIGLLLNPLTNGTSQSQPLALRAVNASAVLESDFYVDTSGNLILSAASNGSLSGGVFFQAGSAHTNIADFDSGGLNVYSGNVTISSLAGSGTGSACITSAGRIIRC